MRWVFAAEAKIPYIVAVNVGRTIGLDGHQFVVSIVIAVGSGGHQRIVIHLYCERISVLDNKSVVVSFTAEVVAIGVGFVIVGVQPDVVGVVAFEQPLVVKVALQSGIIDARVVVAAVAASTAVAADVVAGTEVAALVFDECGTRAVEFQCCRGCVVGVGDVNILHFAV